MTTPDQLADATRVALYWTLVADAVQEQLREARTNLDTLMAAAGSAKQVHPHGEFTRASGGYTGIVTDPEALLNWTKAHRPDMIREVLDPRWVDLVKSMAAEFGIASDPETGEAIPGVTRTTKSPVLRVRKDHAAAAAVRAYFNGWQPDTVIADAAAREITEG